MQTFSLKKTNDHLLHLFQPLHLFTSHLFSFSSLFFTTTTTNPSSFALLLQTRLHTTTTSTYLPTLSLKAISSNTLLLNATSTHCKYVYPDPVPEFAQTESLKFRSELRKKLWTNKEFGDDLDKVVSVCEEIFKDFLHKEYGGPGTLLVEPFTDMLVALKENKLPGAPEAARAALLWAQNYLDKDWEIWISQTPQ